MFGQTETETFEKDDTDSNMECLISYSDRMDVILLNVILRNMQSEIETQ